MSRKALKFFIPALLVLTISAKAHAETCPSGVPSGVTNCFFVSYTHGSDSNSGATEASPWQHAPGMQGCTANCNITPSAGTGIILQGSVTWPNAAFSWFPAGTGASGSPIYYGVDQTWWDSTISGSWTRPIFNLGNAAVTDSLQRIIVFNNPYVVMDNFEITNISARDSLYRGENETHVFDVAGTANLLIENCYVHGWHDEYFSIGTGNIAAGSSTVTNFVPLSYSPMSPSSSWATNADVIIGDVSGHTIPQGSNGAVVTSVTGSNPYTIVWTGSTDSSGCKRCTITLGNDFLRVFAGSEAGNTNVIAQNNLIDGSDSTAASINPNGDCGASEGNNNWCGASGIGVWRGPQIFRNNTFRYLASGEVGACVEWSGNVVEYMRLSTNAGAHTNGIECLDTLTANNVSLFYNNVLRHWSNPNSKTPGGRSTIGLGIEFSPPSGSTSYFFNNIAYDTLQNVWLGMPSGTTGCQSSCGSAVIFNNSSDGGPSWNHSYAPVNPCPAIFASCTFKNNHWITNNASQFGGACGSNCTVTKDLLETVARANAAGYTENQTYAFAPIAAKSPTVGAGAGIASFCSALGAANAAAGAACQNDTTYGGGRTTTSRGSTPDIGAYQAPR